MGRRWWHKSDQMCKGEVFVLQIPTCELLLSIIGGGGKRALPRACWFQDLTCCGAWGGGLGFNGKAEAGWWR